MKQSRFFLFAVCVLCWSAAVFGQSTISGRVIDATSAPMSDVMITMVKQQLKDTTKTDGLFQFNLPSSILAPHMQSAMTGFSIHNGHISLTLSKQQPISISLFDMRGRKVADILEKTLTKGSHDICLTGPAASIGAGMYCLRLSCGDGFTNVKILSAGGKIVSAYGAGEFQGAAGPFKRAEPLAAADTISFAKSGYVTRKVAIASLTTQILGDLILQGNSITDPIAVHNTNQDQYDLIIIHAVAAHGMDSSLVMIIKSQIVIESGFNAQAISMYDTQLPCGSHSYGLCQVTPACVSGFATLPSTTAVTATITGGLNGNPAVLTYANPADKTNGNTIVKESNVVIDLVTNPANPLWATSAFNPAYEIDYGVKALASVMSEMKTKFPNCTAPNYVSMALAGYNQGSSVVTGCTSYGNGQGYVTSLLSQYHTFCTQAGITPAY